MVRLKSLLTAPDPEFRFGAEDAVRKSGNPAAMALLHQVEDTLRKGVQGGDPKREVDSKSGESVSRRHDANSCVSRRANVASKRIVVQFQPNDGTLVRWISEHSSRAKAEALLPCVQFYGDWCGACQKLRASFDHPLMRDAISGTYIMQVDLNANLAEIVALRFDIQSIPIFFILDATGRPTGSKIDGGAWADNIPENMAPPLMAFFKKARAA